MMRKGLQQLVAKIKKLLGIKPNPYIGQFSDWYYDKYFAWSPDNKYCFWIASGFHSFRDRTTINFDYDLDMYIRIGDCPFINKLPKREKRKVWKALMQDLRTDGKFYCTKAGDEVEFTKQ